MNKHVYLGLSILETSKTVMHEIWYDYIEPKYGEKQMIFIKTLQKMLKQGLTLEIKRKEQESYQCNETWVRCKTHERISWIKSQKL